METPVLAHPDAGNFLGTCHFLQRFGVHSQMSSRFFCRQKRFEPAFATTDKLRFKFDAMSAPEPSKTNAKGCSFSGYKICRRLLRNAPINCAVHVVSENS